VTIPEDVALAYDGVTWTLTFDRYRATFPACACALEVCTCRRPAITPWGNWSPHQDTHCHSGHAEHMTVRFRQIVRGVKR
jgi:hypothetical protein